MPQYRYVEMLYVSDSVLFNAVSDDETLDRLLALAQKQIPSAIMSPGERSFKAYPIAVLRFEKLKNKDWEVYKYLFDILLHDQWEIFTVYGLTYITGTIQRVAPVHCFRKLR